MTNFHPQSECDESVQAAPKSPRPLLSLSGHRDLTRWFRGSFAGALSCIALYTLFGFILVSRHAHVLSSQMELLYATGMHPLIGAGDPYLTSFAHRLGSGLFFGTTVGILIALIAMAFSIAPWLGGRFSLKDGVSYLAFGALSTYLGYSGEAPVLSFLFGFTGPLFFFLPWALIVRKSTPRNIAVKRWLVIALAASTPFGALMISGGGSFGMVRDSMVTMPVMRSLSDFYYNHTLLAAHVIKPIADHEQKVIAVSDTIRQIGPIPHGSLWIVTPDPCSLKGKSMAVSRDELPCESFVIPDERPANAANRVIREYSAAYDKNERLRLTIGLFFFRGPILMVPVFFMLWFSLFLSNLWTRSATISILFLAGFMALFTPAAKNMYNSFQLARHPDRLAQYILSEHEERRFLALSSFPDEFTNRELIRYARDESPRIRLRALIEAGERGSVDFLEVLGEAIFDPQLNVRTKACQALGGIDSEKATELLQTVFLSDTSWYVRAYAYRALAKTHPAAKIVRTET